MNRLEVIAAHYEHCWNAKAESLRLECGPVWQLTPRFRILAFPPTASREMWSYATCGMSTQGDAPALELHLFSPVKADSHVELLTAIAHYHLTGEYLNLGHTVNFGRPWLLTSKCDHGLVSLPYLDGPRLEWLEQTGKKTRFLWLIPVTQDEAQYAKSQGLENLGSRFEASNFDYLNPERPSVV
jgi:hypothetical protein